MKKFLIGLISVVSIFGLLSCESNALDPMNGDSSDNSLARRHGGRSNPACPAEGTFAGYNEVSSNYGTYSYTLWADKDIDVGTVDISNDDENIYVTYTTDETVELEKIRVFVWTSVDDISNRRPAPGHADYSANHIDAFTYTAVIPAAAICDDNYYITANAKVKYIEDEDDEDDENGDEDEDDDDDRRGHHNDDDEDDDDRHGHDHHRAMEAYAGDAASPACFDDAGRKWWSYVSYSVDCSASISGSVYEDVNSSETFDTGDTGFEGISVTASASDGNVYTVTTAADGSYLFEHLPTGHDYTVISDFPTGDFTANENAQGYVLANLMADESQVNFGFYHTVNLSECGISESLYAGVGLSAGTVSIANDEDNLYITFASNELCDLGEVYLEINPQYRSVGDPSTYNANSYIVATDLPADSYTVTVPFADTGFTCADQFIVKALAVLTVDAATGSNTFVGVSAFGGENYKPSRAGDYGDIVYGSCCPTDGPL